jgi:fructokinase
MGKVVVLGETVVDLVPIVPASGTLTLAAHPGGSPANVAVGLARLDVPTAFAGRLSATGFGPWLRTHLAGNGVDLGLAVTAAENCSLAIVTLDDAGTPSYTFYVEGTADWQWQSGELPDLRSMSAPAVHTGSLAVALPPGRDVVTRWVIDTHAAGEVVVSLDLNVRPTLIADLARYRKDMVALIGHAHLVKASQEDLGVLYPDADPVEVAREWARLGPQLVVVTHGPDGASAVRPDGRTLHRVGLPVTVVDAVGAGDAFTAGFLAKLSHDRHLHSGLLAALDDSEVIAALDVANRVASITCTRAGADPPRGADLS